MALSLKWKRPETLDYPKVWYTFKARDLDSDELVEYRIQDLPLDRADDALEHMIANFVHDEPIGQVLGKSTNCHSNQTILEQIFLKVAQKIRNTWRIINQLGSQWLSKKCRLFVSKLVPMKSLAWTCFLWSLKKTLSCKMSTKVYVFSLFFVVSCFELIKLFNHFIFSQLVKEPSNDRCIRFDDGFVRGFWYIQVLWYWRVLNFIWTFGFA